MGLLRLFLALSVVVAHTTPLLGLQLMPSFIAVHLFFIISGFYMSLILSGKYRGARHVRIFYTNRFLRLYPAYLIAIVLTAAIYFISLAVPRAPEQSGLIAEIHNHFWGLGGQLNLPTLVLMLIPNLFIFGSDLVYLVHHVAAGWLFTLGLQPAGLPQAMRGSVYLLIPPAWSIGIELWFYLAAPLLVRWATPVIACLAGLSLALHISMDMWRPWSDYSFFPGMLWFFLFGILAHRFWLSEGFQCNRNRPATMAVACIGLGLMILREWIPGYRNYPGLIYAALIVTLPFLFEAFKDIPWDRWIGNLSYPVYLLHTAVIVLVSNYFHSLLAAPIILVTLVISALVNFGVEEPLERYRQRRVARIGMGM